MNRYDICLADLPFIDIGGSKEVSISASMVQIIFVGNKFSAFCPQKCFRTVKCIIGRRYCEAFMGCVEGEPFSLCNQPADIDDLIVDVQCDVHAMVLYSGSGITQLRIS